MSLRGTRSRRAETLPAVPISLANKVARLSRQVARNKASPNYYGLQVQPVSTATTPFGYQAANVNVTTSYVGSPQFPSDINGDEWYNKMLRLRYTGEPSAIDPASNPPIDQFRLVVYSPRLADTVFRPANTRNGFTELPDPAAFIVYWDEVIQNPNSLQPLEWSRNIKLRMRKTIYNRSNSTLETGPIKVTLLYYNGEDNRAGTLGYQLITYDK